MKKKTLIWVIVAILVIGGVGFGIYFWQAKRAEREKAELQKQIQEQEKKKTEEEKEKNLVYVSAIEGLNLREEPSVTSKGLAVMFYGSGLEVLEEKDLWYKVKYEDKIGWCMKEYSSKEKPPELSIKDRDLKTVIDDYYRLRKEFNPKVSLREYYVFADILYGDLTGDNRKDAVVPILFGGSGAIQEFFVYGYQDGYFLTRYFFSEASHENDADFKGHNSIKIQNQYIVETFPLYKVGDPNCCPTGGMKYIYYKWNGQTFIVDHTTKK